MKRMLPSIKAVRLKFKRMTSDVTKCQMTHMVDTVTFE